VAGPFWAIANVAPPSSKAAAKPIRTDFVMIFSMPIPEPPEEHPTGTNCSQSNSNKSGLSCWHVVA
jgi:hypothetical protein